jgi:hypothetical protein
MSLGGTLWTQAPRFTGARVRRDAALSINSGVNTAVEFDTVLFDQGDLFDTDNSTRLTARTGGWYAMGFNVAFAANGTGVRAAFIQTSTGALPVFSQIPGTAGGLAILAGAGVWQLERGDYIELYLGQDSGGSLAITVASSWSPSLWIARMG